MQKVSVSIFFKLSTMKKPESFDIATLVEYLQGTCHTLNEAIATCFGDEYDEDILDDNDHDYIDNEIFLCAECNWWCEISEARDKDGENVCEDCGDNED